MICMHKTNESKDKVLMKFNTQKMKSYVLYVNIILNSLNELYKLNP